MSTLVFVRHGIFSSSDDMRGLEDGITARCPGVTVQNESYEWRNSVLLSGIRLATRVERECREGNAQHVVLIGHSQGGLVCRVAAAALSDKRRLAFGVVQGSYVDAEYRSHGARELLELRGTSASLLRGVITLGTPNSGAVTHGQLSTLGKLALEAANLIGSLGASRNLQDLTTDRLFRVLQHVAIPEVQYLSISGSSINRFSRASHSDLESIPIVNKLGLRLQMPNDLVVEDESVDISKAVLLPEIADIERQYQHIRWYIDCVKVHHTSVHTNDRVLDHVASRIKAWAPRAQNPEAAQ